MKIKLSKSKWEEMGRKAGWLKLADENVTEECSRCHGSKLITKRIKNLGTLEYCDSVEICPICNGKGYTTNDSRRQNQQKYLHDMGVSPHPKN